MRPITIKECFINSDCQKHIQLTAARPADVEEIMRIEVAAGLSPWSKEDYAAEISRVDSIFLVVKDQTDMVKGFILSRLIMSEFSYSSISSAIELEIYNLAVDNSFERCGFGTLLLKGALQTAVSKGVEKVHLEVRASNKKAQKFYLKNGFRNVGSRKNFYADPVEDALLMCLDLSVP